MTPKCGECSRVFADRGEPVETSTLGLGVVLLYRVNCYRLTMTNNILHEHSRITERLNDGTWNIVFGTKLLIAHDHA
jgi:hypothetical protein